MPLEFLIVVLFTAPVAMHAQFTCTTNVDGVTLTITGYRGPPWAVTIPTNINGLTVTSIGNSAFYLTPFTSVTIPGSVTSIGTDAFESCSSLTSIIMPSSVTSIGPGAFSDCVSLASVTIANSFIGIGADAFEDCSGLTSLFFTANAPTAGVGYLVFTGDNEAKVYYLPGTTGWSSTFDGLATVLWNLITVQPQSQTNNTGRNVTFSVSAASSYPMVYQWLRNSTNLVDGGNISGSTNSNLTIADISDSDEASYFVVVSNAQLSVTSTIANLTVVDPPSFAAQPTNLLVLAGTSVAFGVNLTGTPPFNYQWLLNSANVHNATNAMYTIPSANTNEAGNYSVVVSNQAGNVTSSNAALTVVLSPPSQTAYPNSTGIFTVTAIGPEPLNYQWQKNGSTLTNGGNISGATSSALTIASISDADAASYSAVVSDAYSRVTTPAATLTVNDSLFFSSQPLSQKVAAGTTVTFTAVVGGAPPFVFQWYFNQSPVGSATAGTNVSSLVLTKVGTNQAGKYGVQVFNGSGSLTSSNAVLTVILPPTLALEMLAGYPVLSLYGTLGNGFLVQYNTNLADTTWLKLVSITNLSSTPYQFLDPSGVGQPERFYRAFLTQ